MRKTLIALTTALALAGATSAFAKDTYVGGTFGGNISDGINTDAPWSIGVVAGKNVASMTGINIGVEGTFDYSKSEEKNIALNVVPSVTINSFTPYVLAGVGYRWALEGDVKTYNVGGGIRYGITESVDLDVRYRYVNDWDGNTPRDVATVGINFKF